MAKRVLPASLIESMRIAFEAGTARAEIAAMGGVSKSYLSQHMVGWGWVPERPLRRRRRMARMRHTPVFVAPPDGTPLQVRLELLVAHRIEALEIEAASSRAIDPDANARAIAANARTLALLRRLPPAPKEEVATDDEPPRSLAALRDELRRHLERIAEEERAGSLPGGPDATGDREAAGPLAGHLPEGAATA